MIGSDMRRVLAHISLVLGLTVGMFGLAFNFSTTLLGVSIVVLGIAAIIYLQGDWIIPALLGIAGRHPVYDDLEIENDAVIMRAAGRTIAVGYIVMEVQRTPSEESDKQKATYVSMLTTFYSQLPTECTISQNIHPLDLQKVRERLQSEYYDALAKAADAAANNNLAKEKEYKNKAKDIESQLSSLDKDRPIDVLYFAKVSGVGISKEAAIEEMRTKRQKVEYTLRAVLRVSTRVPKGQEFLDLIKIDMLVPPREYIK